MSDEKLLLNHGEAARLLGISETTLRQMRDRGDVPGVVRLGNRARYSVEALKEWIAAGLTKTHAQ